MRSMLDEAVARRPALAAELLGSRGAYATATLNLSTIAVSALELGQFKYVVDRDVAAARSCFEVPLGEMASPGFGQLAQLVDEGRGKGRAWDGRLMELAGELERVICYLLLRRYQQLNAEYDVVHRPELFNAVDFKGWRATFTRHLVHAASGEYNLISSAEYDRCRDLKPGEFVFGYHRAICALGAGDEDAFAREMTWCSEAFAKRGSSRQVGVVWGYREASAWTFDVIGTVLLGLAERKGMRVTAPSVDLYPEPFWKAGALAH